MPSLRALFVGLLVAAAALVAGFTAATLLGPAPDRGFPIVDVPGVSNGDRAAAMVSIHAHAREPDREAIPGVWPLERAVDLLRRDQGPAAASRRRRAIAKLAGYGLRDGDWSPRFAAAIEALGVRVDDLRSLLLPAEATPPSLEAMFMNWLVFLTPTCPWQVPEPTGGVQKPPTIVLQWNFEAKIPRDVVPIARALDPQSWECSTFFTASHLTKTPASCCPHHPQQSVCSVTTGPDGRPAANDSRPRGKPFADCSLYEYFCYDEAGFCGSCGAGKGCQTRLENLLCVTTQYDSVLAHFASWLAALAGRYDVYFHLGKPLVGEVAGNPNFPLASDQGSLSVRRATAAETPAGATGPWSVAHSDKSVRFVDPGATSAMVEILVAVEDELAGQLVEQACCDVPPEIWGWHPSRLRQAVAWPTLRWGSEE